MKIKICGITNREDAEVAVAAGADALGFVMYRNSPRWVEPETARSIIAGLSPFVLPVGVFVNEEAERVRVLWTNAAMPWPNSMEMNQRCIVSISVVRR